MRALRDGCRLMLLTLVLAAPAWAQPDALPSWQEGATKQAIIDFVQRVTTEGSPDFVPVAERIAVFDNDGTLWQEKPVAEGMFALERLREKAAADPSLRQRQPYKAALEGDKAYFSRAGERAIAQILALTHAGMSEARFAAEAAAFLRDSRHPTLNAPYPALAYQPMLELLDYLRANGFQTWIASGGSQSFVRVLAGPTYGIPPEQVIGTRPELQPAERDGELALQREPKLATLNDKREKPVNIHIQAGQPPLFAAGNVRSGGDIAMLRYSDQRPGASFQLLINHDDAQRESAYQEPDNASLRAAAERGWHVVSMRRDWRQVFPDAAATTPDRRAAND